jgi:putative membrane protein
MRNKTITALGFLMAAGNCSMVCQAAPAPSKPSPTDVRFMRTLAQGNTAEIQQGKLALSKTKDTRVHNVAATIVQDHTQAGAALMQVAAKEGVTLPTQTDPMHKAIYAKLTTLSGMAFDNHYISGQVKDHDKTVAMIHQEMDTTHNALLLAFLKQTLPKILGHTAELHQINASLRAGNPGPIQSGLKPKMAM